MKKKMFLVIFITLIWTIFIFYNSSNNGVVSNKRSNYVLALVKKSYETFKNNSIFKFNFDEKIINGNILKKQMITKKINIIVRKNAHFFEYMILAILISVCYKYIIKKSSVVNILFICLLCAVLDEFNQSFVNGRTSSVRDILIDFGGSLVGMIIFETWRTLNTRKKNALETQRILDTQK